ncbi:MAG: MarR family transcriptional regulator [Anaerolineales bacterium]|nr:MarR family transcriptional regulator [Anaerolineales bacterium]
MQQSKAFSEAFREWSEIFMGRSMHRFMMRAKESGISMPQIGTLMRIHRQGALPVSDISKEMGTTLAATSQLVERLVQQGLITRTEDPNDRRVRLIAMTDKGRAILDASLRARQQWIDDLAGTLTPDELTTVTDALHILITRARAIDPASEA